jgi:glycosyltransferase involved in cell wall biosynthesis
MKVAFLNLSQFVGGAERELVDTAVEMKEHYGIGVLAIIDARNAELTALLKANKVPFASMDILLHREQEVAARSFGNVKRVVTQARFLRSLVERSGVDLLVTYSFHSGVVGAIARLWGMRAKLVIAQVARRDLTRGGFLLEHLQYFAADGVTYNSQDLRRSFGALARRFKRPERIIYSYVKPPVIAPGAPTRASFLAARGLPPDTTLIGYFGRIFEYKRVCDLVQAVGLLNAAGATNNYLMVMGSAVPVSDYENYVRELAREQCPEQHCFLPFSNDPFAAMAACDVLVLPSVEPFGRVLVEAMYLGVPFVAVNQAGPKEIMALADPHAGELVPPLRPDLIADAIARLIARGRGRVVPVPQALSRDGIIGGMLQFYRDILTGPVPRPASAEPGSRTAPAGLAGDGALGRDHAGR